MAEKSIIRSLGISSLGIPSLGILKLSILTNLENLSQNLYLCYEEFHDPVLQQHKSLWLVVSKFYFNKFVNIMNDIVGAETPIKSEYTDEFCWIFVCSFTKPACLESEKHNPLLNILKFIKLYFNDLFVEKHIKDEIATNIAHLKDEINTVIDYLDCKIKIVHQDEKLKKFHLKDV
jgi:hypothetical protein